MNNNDRINQYLEELNRHLFTLSQIDRENIINELKENIQLVLTQNPNLSTEDLINSLGSAKIFANGHLISRGFPPTRLTKGKSTLKIFSLLILSCIALIILGISLLIHKFTPFINLDSQKGRVSLLGDSLIFTTPTQAPINPFIQNSKTTQFNGEQWIDQKSVDSVIIKFDSGHFTVAQSDSSKITWKCNITSNPDSEVQIPAINSEIKSFHMDFSELDGTNCQLQVPKGLHFSLNGNSGSVILSKIQFHAFIEMEDGEVEWENDPSVDYQFLLQITNGQMDQFESSKKADSFKIEIKLENGSIIHK